MRTLPVDLNRAHRAGHLFDLAPEPGHGRLDPLVGEPAEGFPRGRLEDLPLAIVCHRR